MTKRAPAPLPRRAGVKRSLLAFVLLLTVALGAFSLPARPVEGESVTLTILGTTDIHGNVWPYDYLRGERAGRGLAKVSSYVKQVRAQQPNVLLVDTGDTFQGTPLAYYAATKFLDDANPTIAAMNAMRYDAMAVGNHEWNFGLRTLWRFKEQAEFPILGANVVSIYHDRLRDFEPYVIREVASVRVALLGLVTPGIPRWDPPDHWTGYEFRDPVEVAKKLVPKLRKKADVVVVLIHSGLGRDDWTGEALAGRQEEDRAWELAEQVPGIDVIFFGHSHRELPGKLVNGVLLVQPRNWAQSVAEVTLTLRREGEHWKLAEKTGRVVAMDASVRADLEILDLTRAAHQRTERELNTVVATLGRELNGRTGLIEDHALVEIIHRAQLEATGADVSLAALFGTFTRWQPGPVTMRDVYSLYFYENTLVSVEITGQQLRDALEQAVSVYATYPWPNGAFPFSRPGYNLDFAQGVSYQVDLTKPAGERIADLRLNGKLLDPARTLTVAINSYRWSGGGHFEMLRHAKVVKRVDRQVRDLIADYLLARGQVSVAVDNNWQIVPAEARQALQDWVNRPRR